jgi:hypothetical protein
MVVLRLLFEESQGSSRMVKYPIGHSKNRLSILRKARKKKQ